jgi:hypothetical protein
MLVAVDPLLQRIEAVPEHGCYSVTFKLPGDRERSVIMKVTDPAADGVPEVVVPEANMIAGWSRSSDTFRAVLTAVRAVAAARQVGGGEELLRDVPGGWDVGVGNVVLEDGLPACVAHGPLELTEAGSGTYACATCGASARYGGTTT